jgi:hypothetical protein
MAKGLLDFDEGSRRVTIFHQGDNGKHLIETRQDCTHIVEAAKILSEETPGKDFRLAAVIPQTVLTQAMNEGWFHDKKAWKRWANDPNNRDFRVWKGRL